MEKEELKKYALILGAAFLIGILLGIVPFLFRAATSISFSRPSVEKPQVRTLNQNLKHAYNELGKVLVLEYHKFAEEETDQWTRSYTNFRKDLERLYKEGYRLVSSADFFAEHRIAVPAGKKPLIITFDDASPRQFHYLVKNGKFEIDPNSAVGIMDEFYKKHPDFGRAATFFVLFPSFPQSGNPTLWKDKLKYLVKTGREIGSHTLNHDNLAVIPYYQAEKSMAAAVKTIRAALGVSYEVKSLALPYGGLPKKYKFMLLRGTFGETTYQHEAVFLVGSEPTLPPLHTNFSPLYIQRVQARDKELNLYLNYIQKHPEEFYLSDGDPGTITLQEKDKDNLNRSALKFKNHIKKLRIQDGRKAIREEKIPHHSRKETRNKLGKKGVYFTFYMAASPKRIDEVIKKMKKAGADTLVVDIKDFAGIIGAELDLPLAKKIGAVQPYIKDLKGLIDKLHKNGIRFAGRITVFKDRLLAKQMPSLAVKDKNTGGSWTSSMGQAYWVDPFAAAVHKYNIDLAAAVAQAGADEIQFDYIRFPSREGKISNCLYTHNKTGAEKHVAIEKFLFEAETALSSFETAISVDVFGVMAWQDPLDIEATAQRLWEMGKYVDAIYPMLYPSHFDPGFENKSSPANEPYYFIKEGCRRTQNMVAGTGARVIPWIQGFDLRVYNFGPQYIRTQIQAAADCGIDGYLVWNAHNDYSVAWEGMRN